MTDSVEALRAEIAALKDENFTIKAQVWALADFFSMLSDALGTVDNGEGPAKRLRKDFISNLRDLYKGPPDAEVQVQKVFRRDVFGEL